MNNILIICNNMSFSDTYFICFDNFILLFITDREYLDNVKFKKNIQQLGFVNLLCV